MMREYFWPFFWSCLAVVVVIVIGTAIFRAINAPQVQNGYNNNLSTLLGDYCSSPLFSDQETIRQKVLASKRANPDAYNALPSDLHTDAEFAIAGDRVHVCHIGARYSLGIF